MNNSYFILAINPGSTSTKVAVFKDELMIYGETIRHSSEELKEFNSIIEQYPLRKKVILDTLKAAGVRLEELSSIVGRGGLLKPLQGGTYKITNSMLADLKRGERGSHASNLGALLAYEIAAEFKVPSYIVDPVVVDEMTDVARITGRPELARRSLFHALNQKAIARRAALDLGKDIKKSNFIVAHLGGGISVGAHQQGRVIDVNNALDGEGPFSPERSGTLPVGEVVRMCYSGEYTLEDMQNKLVGKGGLMAHFGTSDAREVENLISAGNLQAKLVYEAMAYQIAKSIGASAAVLKGEVDAVLITGGLAYGERLVELIKERVSFIAPVLIYPGEDEMMALAQGALRVLKGQEQPKEYS